jgi:ribokinase
MYSSPRIVVVGSANVDLTTFTDVFPRPGETIFGRDFHLGFGGKGANQAVAAARCGASAAMLARVGDDLFGQATIDNFQVAGVDASRVLITPGSSSGVAPIFVDSTGQNRIIVVKAANDRLQPTDIDAATEVIREADFVILQLEIPLETVYYTVQLAAGFGVKTILNPAPGCALDFERLQELYLLIPNETEAGTLTGMDVQSIEDARAAAQFLMRKGMQRVIITLGAQGALYAEAGDLMHVPAFPVEAMDSTGAGDGFIGSLATFLAEETAVEKAIQKANLYAALSTLSIGTQSSFVTRDRFEQEWAVRKIS